MSFKKFILVLAIVLSVNMVRAQDVYGTQKKIEQMSNEVADYQKAKRNGTYVDYSESPTWVSVFWGVIIFGVGGLFVLGFIYSFEMKASKKEIEEYREVYKDLMKSNSADSRHVAHAKAYYLELTYQQIKRGRFGRDTKITAESLKEQCNVLQERVKYIAEKELKALKYQDNITEHEMAVVKIAEKMKTLEDDHLDVLTQVCPKCAETLKAKAVKCRFCDHEFETLESQMKEAKSRVELFKELKKKDFDFIEYLLKAEAGTIMEGFKYE